MGIKTVPSRLIYSIDIPEVSNFETRFVYNFYTPDEVTNDTGIFTDYVIEKMNVSQDVLSQVQQGFSSQINLTKAPRYVKISYSIPSKEKVKIVSTLNKIQKRFLEGSYEKIITEDQFATSYYTSVSVNNGSLDEQVSSLFEGLNKDQTKFQERFPNSVLNTQSTFGEVNTKVLSEVMALQLQKGGTNFRNKEINPYFKKLKSVKFNSQINNNFLYDLFLNASGSYHLNNQSFAKQLDFAKTVKNVNSNFDLTDDEFKPSIPYYKKELRSDVKSEVEILGYLIEKSELFPGQIVKNYDPIVITGGSVNSYIDFNVRYGAVYTYKIKTIASITYDAVENDSLKFYQVKSLVGSKPVTSVLEAIENVAPPTPVEIKYVWDYDRVNPTTATFDHANNRIFPNTGTRGSLFMYWSYPVNTQMDIKKFQVFRRKSVEDPFELIKVFDFNDSIIEFEDLDDRINPALVQITTPNPTLSFYDDDFTKSSDYIYSVTSVDAHGLTSNYSEQFRVRFDSFSNKVITTLISIAGAPKQYPNLYLEKDLFVDTMKTSSKNLLSVYFTPKCYYVTNGDNPKEKVISNVTKNTNQISKYLMNFINVDNQKNAILEIKINDSTKDNKLK